MPVTTPSFSVKPLTEKPKPKRKIVRRRARVALTQEAAPSQAALDRGLASIYKDASGQMPNMKEIKVKKGSSVLGLIFTVLIIGGLLAGLAWAGFFLLPGASQFSEAKVDLEIMGPRDLNLGATTTYNINYKNREKVPLKNALLSVSYPEGFVFVESSVSSSNAGHTEWPLNSLASGEEGNLAITGRVYGALNQKFSWRVFLNYKPDNLASEIKKVATLETQIVRSPLKISLSAPDKVTGGQETELTFKVESDDGWPSPKLELEPTWPANFFLTSSSPKLQGNKWLIALSAPTSSPSSSAITTETPAEFIFKVRGKFGDSAETAMPLGAKLFLPLNEKQKRYQVAETEVKTELTKNALAFNLAINGSLTNLSAAPGDALNITLSFKNNNQTDLTKGALKLILDAPSANRLSLLNWKEINDKYDGNITGQQISDTVRRGVIVWNSAKIPALSKLKAGEEISVDVRLPLKTAADFDLADLKEYKISATAEATFTGAAKTAQTVAANPLTITVNSDLKFEQRDTLSESGGNTHEIKWVLTNNFHSLKNLTLAADLYGDIAVEILAAPAGEAKFDESAKRLTWTVPEMPESVDVLALPLTVTLNKKNPTQNTLVSKVHVQAEDAVTGEKLDFMGDEISLIAE